MRPAILRLDDAVTSQPEVSAAVADRGGTTLEARDLGPLLRLWGPGAALEALRGRIRGLPRRGGEAALVFAGSGDFHHVTPVLLARALEGCDAPVTLLHFDNHPDWVRFAAGRHCGSWVGRAARLPGVAKVVTIGVCSGDIGRRRSQQGDLSLIDEGRLELFAWTAPDGGDEVALQGRAWPTISALGEAAFLDRLDRAIDTAAIYVTVDKDVLRPADAVTNWDQGQASLDFVEAAVRRAANGRRLIGADVVGDWSAPRYGGGPAARALKAGEAWLDQPRRRPEPGAARAVNAAANLRLIDLFAEAAA